MHRIRSLALVILAGAMVPRASAAVFTVDDFESYTDGQLIGPSFNSQPWLRFGQVADGVYASSTSATAGALGAEIPVAVGPNGWAVAARNFGAANDFSGYATASIDARSKAAASAAGLQLSLSDGTTTYLSNVAQPLTGTAATYTFSLAGADYFLADGTASFAAVLASTVRVGVQISSVTGTSETIAFDNFTLATAVPEPTTLGVASAAGAMLLRRRRRA